MESHGLARLLPNRIAEDRRSLETTLRVNGAPRRVRIAPADSRTLEVTVAGRAPSAAATARVLAAVRTMFALDDDLSHFYARIEGDPDLDFARCGIGRLLRAPTAFEEVARTICTTNCAWSGTIRMVEALVHLGGGAFPTPQQVAGASEKFFKDVARAGYRGAYLRKLGELAASDAIDLEALRSAARAELSDDELERRLLALPGVGPYAAAHVMLLFGRRSRLVLDSWTRPTYLRLIERKKLSDASIARRFKRYGDEAGLAFWLFLWKNRHLASAQ